MRETETRRRRRIAILGVASSFLCSFVQAGEAAAAESMFTGLGDLPGGIFDSRANDVSADGSTVVGRSVVGEFMVMDSTFPIDEGFSWQSASGLQGLGDLGGLAPSSSANGVSAIGSVVVGGSWTLISNNNSQAFRWTSGGGMVGLGDLPGGVFDSTANSVSADGSTVVGSSHSASGTEAFRWTSGTGMVGLGDLAGGSFLSVASGVSADGSTVVGWATSAASWPSHEAFGWTSGGGMVGLGDLSGGIFRSVAIDVSADGSTVVGWGASAAGTEAFRWTSAGGMVGLGDLPGGSFGSSASGVSADGSTIVGASSGASGSEAFIWDATHGMRELDQLLVDLGLGPVLNGWTLAQAAAVSDDGLTIVGQGINPHGKYEAWLAVIGEPASPKSVPSMSRLGLATLAALLVAAVFVGYRRR